MKAIVLAAGKGTRMDSDLPKVLHPLCGRPLISHVIDNIRSAGINDITVVIGYQGEKVINILSNTVSYAWQKEQLGTGHAVLQAEEYFTGYTGDLIIACGDVPLIKSTTFSTMISKLNGGIKGAVLTMIPESPKGYGRIVHSDADMVDRIVEEKDATDDERFIKEVNSGTYAFNSPLLFEALKRIGNSNAQNEYYLPDVVKYINLKGYAVVSSLLDDPIEGSGVNTIAELKKLEEYVLRTEVKI